MSNLKQVFTDEKAFIAFVVAGDPNFDATVDHIVALAEGGADIVEIGLPFSDPVADGPVIQEADLRAFAAGANTDKVFDLVAAVRQRTQVPLVFLTYLNLIFKYGYDAFCAKCAELGVSGLVIPDMPYEERAGLAPYADQHGVDLVPLITPTSGDRIAKIAQAATGFIYVVSSLGITGTRDEIQTDLGSLVSQIKAVTDIPTAIGFGVHTPDQAAALGQVADGVIVGSAIVKLIAEHGDQAAPYLKQYAHEMKAALPAK